MDIAFILNQAFEESRYHRRFHHTVYTLFMTLYVALLGFQVSFSSDIGGILRGTDASLGKLGLPAVITLGVFVFVFIPVCVFYIIIRGHMTIATLNSLVANINSRPEIQHGLTVKGTEKLNKAFDLLLFAKYSDIIAEGRNPMSRGKGQWFFLITLTLIIIVDIIVSVLIYINSGKVAN